MHRVTATGLLVLLALIGCSDTRAPETVMSAAPMVIAATPAPTPTPPGKGEWVPRLEQLAAIGPWPGGGGQLAWYGWSHCNSCNADGSSLVAVASDGHTTTLATVDMQAGSYSWSPSGRRLLIGTGGDRFVILGDPRVVICDFPELACSSLPQPPGQVDLTPAWSPDGRFITFARGPAPALGPDVNATVAAWQDTLDIWIARADGTGQLRLDTPGGSYPSWSDDGRAIYFVHAGRRWRHDLYSGENLDTGTTVAGTLGRGWITYGG